MNEPIADFQKSNRLAGIPVVTGPETAGAQRLFPQWKQAAVLLPLNLMGAVILDKERAALQEVGEVDGIPYFASDYARHALADGATVVAFKVPQYGEGKPDLAYIKAADLPKEISAEHVAKMVRSMETMIAGLDQGANRSTFQAGPERR